MALIYTSLAFLCGIWLGGYLDFPPFLILTSLLPLPTLFFFSRQRKAVIIASVCLFAFFGGGWHYQQSLPQSQDNHIQAYNDAGEVTITGILSRDPDHRDTTSHLYIEVETVQIDGQTIEAAGSLLAIVPLPSQPGFGYGDEVSLTGELETPPVFDDFDYKGYLASQGISSISYYPDVELAGTDNGSPVLGWIYGLRSQLAEGLNRLLPQPQAALAEGITLGIRSNIPDDVRSDFSLSGIAHILAISGLHLGIMAGIVLSLGIWLFGRRYHLHIWLALAAVWLYAIITGLNPPVLRAAIMVSVFLSAELFGRQRSAATALLFAAAVMVAFEPYILPSASFQMSFMAMAGLVFLFNPLRDWGRRIISRGREDRLTSAAFFVSDSIAVTLAATAGVWPLIAYYFGIVSLVGPLATLLALPALPFVIIFGGLSAAVSLVLMPLAQVLGWLAWLPLSYLLTISGLAATLPFSHIEASFSPALVWGYYILLALLLWWRHTRKLPHEADEDRITVRPARFRARWLLPILAALAIAATTVAARLPDDNLHISFLDVGQGDAILIQTPGGYDILVDGGPSPQAIGRELGRKMPFWDRTIDLLVLSHPEADHLSGLVEVLKTYQVKQVLYPDIPSDSLLFAEWLALIEEKEIKAVIARAGQRIELEDGVVIEVLSPPQLLISGTASDTNNNSLALSLKLGDISFLLTGDIGYEGELELISSRNLPQATVLKVAHHGSKSSTSAEFLAVAGPHLAIIQVGADNSFGHPAADVLKRLGEVMDSAYIYTTATDGTLEFISDGTRLWLKIE